MARATYDVAPHELLTDAAEEIKSSDIGRFKALNVLAEHVLELHGTSFTGAEEETAKLAVARQVNLLALENPEQYLLESKEQGERTWRYRAGTSPIDSVAKSLAAGLLDKGGTAPRSQTVASNVSWV